MIRMQPRAGRAPVLCGALIAFLLPAGAISAAPAPAKAAPPVVVEAESAKIGKEWRAIVEGTVTYLTIGTDYQETTGGTVHPGEQDRVLHRHVPRSRGV